MNTLTFKCVEEEKDFMLVREWNERMIFDIDMQGMKTLIHLNKEQVKSLTSNLNKWLEEK